MKFCLLTSSYPLFPAESLHAGVFVREFALQLKDQGHEVTIFTPAKGRPIEPDPGLTIQTFDWFGETPALTRLRPYHPKDVLRMASLWWNGTREIQRWAPGQMFERVLAFWAIPSGWFAWRLNRKTSVPFDVWCLGSDLWLRRRYPLGSWMVQRVLTHADHILADGTALRDEAEQIARRPAVLLRSMRRLPPPSHPVILEKGKTHFIFVGRWDRVKGVDLFVEAFLGLADEFPCQAHIFGQGPQAHWLAERLKNTPRKSVQVYGAVPPDELSGYLQAADFAVIPSRQESLPVFFFDAMQSGLPVIAADVGDLRSLITTHDVGMVVKPDDVPALKEALKQAVQAGKSRWQASCQRLAATINPQQMVHEYLQIIQQEPR